MDMIPLEILVEILVSSLPSMHDPQVPQRTSLALVCHRWNTVIEANPAFWTKISNHDPLLQVRKSLTKSMRRPIDVNATWTGFAHSTDIILEKVTFLELVNRHIDRWRHVTMDVPTEMFYPLSITPAPLLETLAVFSTMKNQDIQPYRRVKLFNSAWTPRLREVHIGRVGVVDWKTPFPPALSKLIITRVDYRGPRLSDLLTIFVRCPGITTLEISWTRVDLKPDQSWPTHPPIELPALKNLKLWYLETKAIQEILLRLRFPRECVINLACRLPQTNPSTSLDNMLSRYLGDPNDGLIDQLAIIIDDGSDSLTAKGPRWNLAFDFADIEAVRDAVLWFNSAGVADTNGRSQGTARRIVVSLNLDFDDPLGGFNFLCPLWDLQCIKRVTLDYHHIALLSQPVSAMTGDRGKECWAFPGMVELHISQGAESDSIIGLVERERASHDAPGAAAPLQRIEFGGKLEKNSFDPPLDSLFTLLDVLDEDAQLYWYGERVAWDWL